MLDTLRLCRELGVWLEVTTLVIPDEGEDTACPECGTTLIARYGYTVRENRLRAGHCPDCKAAVPGVWA